MRALSRACRRQSSVPLKAPNAPSDPYLSQHLRASFPRLQPVTLPCGEGNVAGHGASIGNRRLDALHIGVRQPEMMADLVHQNVGDEMA